MTVVDGTSESESMTGKKSRDTAYNKRRSAKSHFTRIENALISEINDERSMSEIEESSKNLAKQFNLVVEWHDTYCQHLKDDEFETEEGWMLEIDTRYRDVKRKVRDYMKDHPENSELTNGSDQRNGTVTNEETKTDDIEANTGTLTEDGKITDNSQVDSDERTGSQKTENGFEIGFEASPQEEQMVESTRYVNGDNGEQIKTEPKRNVKLEKIKMPVFSGYVPDYHGFKADFTYLIAGHEPKEALYILKTCLGDHPKKWIQFETNYRNAWTTLDRQYGNPRHISDCLIGEIQKLTKMERHDYTRLQKLYHMIQRAEAVLKNIDRRSDLDNSTMLGIVESKLSDDDRRKWSSRQLRRGTDPNMENLMKFLEDEIWIRQNAEADIRSSVKKVNINSISAKLPEDEYTIPEDSENDPSTQSGLALNYMSGVANLKCWHCTNEHKITDCTVFKSLTPAERLKAVRKMKACYFCLRIHRQPCRIRREKCPEMGIDGNPCTYSHHQMLHGAPFEDKTTSTASVTACSESKSNQLKLLPIITTKVLNPNDCRSRKGNALLDTGGDLSVIRRSFAQSLGLPSKPCAPLRITVAGGDEILENTEKYVFDIQGLHDGAEVVSRVEAVAMDTITKDVEQIDLEWHAKRFRVDVKSLHRESGPVDLLLGVDRVEFSTGNTIKMDNYAYRQTILGPVIFGTGGMITEGGHLNHVAVIEDMDLTKFWRTEEWGVHLNDCCKEQMKGRTLKPEDKHMVKLLRQSAKKINDRWSFKLPYKKDPKLLPDNYKQAKAKMISTETRLLKSPRPEDAKQYDEQIRDLVTAGSARILSEEEIAAYKGPVFYISHHAVYREDKPSHPCRLVFNSAASYKGHVMNEYLHKCGDHLNDLLLVLLRFREQRSAILGDVSKMYHQVLVDPVEDANTHRFLWRNFEKDREPDVYVKQVLTFGDISSPSIANIAMDMTAEQFEDKWPIACETIKESRYMDDIADSFPDAETAAEVRNQIDEILKTGHFTIKEWFSNSSPTSCSNSREILAVDSIESEKVLGVIWKTENDKIAVSVRWPKKFSPDKPMTKRIVLSGMSSAYDVFGIGAPVIIRAKIMMQKLWSSGYDWDDELPPELAQDWMNWFVDLKALSEITIDRCITPNDIVGNPQLITMCDASQDAFGALCYARWQKTDGTYVIKFIIGKSRVAPLRQITLARLELQSAVMASRLTDTVQKSRLQFSEAIHFTDSMIVLSWIKNESRLFDSFVANRVGEIQTKTNKHHWRHVRSEHNSADDISRGIKPEELQNRYLTGPAFLRRPEEEWPEISSTPTIDVDDPVLEAKVNVISASTNQTTERDLPQLANCGSYTKVIRVMAVVHRYLSILRKRAAARKEIEQERKITRTVAKGVRLEIDNRVKGLKSEPITAQELRDAETSLHKLAQSQLKPLTEYASLSPYTDKNGYIRVGGRIDNEIYTYNELHPILLPYHWLSKLIVLHVHSFGHPATAALSARVRKTFWIIGVKRMAKSVVFKCMFCRERNVQFEQQYMANLPIESTTPSPPWFNSSCDLFGPLKILIGKYKTADHYGVLFTCLGTGALHGEIMDDYSAKSFILSFRRFIAVRGRPNSVLSDQGPQLTNASKDITEWCTQRQIKWKLTTPTAAHENGRIEALVKSVKFALSTIIGRGPRRLTVLEFQTIVQEAVNLVNERPIGLLPTDPADGPYISPNDIILGRSGLKVPAGNYMHTVDPNLRLDFVKRVIEDWWQKWSEDVFPRLITRKKWQNERRNVQVDDLVLLSDPQPVYGVWTKGRVTRTFPGPDGKVRKVEVKTANGLYERPITKLAMLLPVEEQSKK